MRAHAPGDLARLRRPALALARTISRAALGFALPQRCPGCGTPAGTRRLLCASCRARIPRLRTPLCARCLASGNDPAGCLRHRGHLVFTPWVFDEHAACVVHALKYGGRPALAAALGRTLAAAVGGAWRQPDLVLEVPLHPARERERGYNQAAALADALAGALEAPRLPGTLVRLRPTAPQARLGETSRQANVSGAFAVRGRPGLAGRRVLIVDDVMTTGATLKECLDVLGAAGARAAGVTLAWTQ